MDNYSVVGGYTLEKITCCPYCESKEGYYLKTKIKGNCETRFSFNGEYLVEENEDMHENLLYEYSKYSYCRSCHKRLFKVSG